MNFINDIECKHENLMRHEYYGHIWWQCDKGCDFLFRLSADEAEARLRAIDILPHREVMGDECAIDGCPYERDGNSMYCADHKVSAREANA